MKDLLDHNLMDHNVFMANKTLFYPQQVIEQIKLIFVSYMQDSDVKINSQYDFDPALRLIGDAERIQQVLLNLLSNARKFVPLVKGKIDIKASIIMNAGECHLSISVTDNGPGISMQDQERLFKPFSKLEANRNLNPNGSGLGLHICSRICTNLEGNIKVESVVGSFTTFTFCVKV